MWVNAAALEVSGLIDPRVDFDERCVEVPTVRPRSTVGVWFVLQRGFRVSKDF